MNKYSENELIIFLTSDNRKLSDYLVLLGNEYHDDVLFSIYENVIFFEIIENEELYLACVDYIKKNAQIYKNEEEIKEKNPHLFFG